jgi:hypothetical protein
MGARSRDDEMHRWATWQLGLALSVGVWRV